jgi:hypothetical protein
VIDVITDVIKVKMKIKRKLKTKYIWGCRCYERLQPNTKEFTRLAYTELDVADPVEKPIKKQLNLFFCSL